MPLSSSTVNRPYPEDPCAELVVDISNITGGYLVSWYSDEENDNTGIYAKRFMLENSNDSQIFSIEPIITENNRRFTMFKNNINNLLEDVNIIEDVTTNINMLIQKGINLTDSIIPLEKQHKEWIDKIDENILFLKNIFDELKEHDNRITSTTEIIFNQTDYNNMNRKDKTEYICNLYKQLFNNIKEDIEILNSVKTNINKYSSIGINLGDANTKIDDQIVILKKAVKKAYTSFDSIIGKSNKEKEIIIND